MKTNSSSNSKAATKKSGAATELQDLFENGLKDIYWAENALVKALPKIVKNCTSPELKQAIEDHLAVTKEQVSRLEDVFDFIDVKPVGKKCEAMAGLIKEAEEMMESATKGVVRDAAIISAAQKVEHYEIASYGTLCAFAKILGHQQAAYLMDQTLNEEKEADSGLTKIAESSINLGAAGEA